MSTLNATPFGNRPARRARLLEYSGQQPSALPDSPIPRYLTVPSPEYWRFRGVESLSAQRIASSRQIFYKLGHFAGPFRCATVRSKWQSYIRCSKNDGDKEIVQWTTGDKNSYGRFILFIQRGLKARRSNYRND